MSNAQKQNASKKEAIVTPVADSATLALSAIRKSVVNVLPKMAIADEVMAVDLPIGEFMMIKIADIKIGDRFRRDLGDIAGMADSVKEVGLLQPILVNTELQLVSGIRRLEAHRHLGREQILARVLDIEDPVLASIEEDRSRKPLLATEKFAVTEMLRGKMTDEAWRRRGLGRKLAEAEAKGRVDDILARHVGISRPTLRKICVMSKAAKENPERYAAIVEELDRDGKVDRHYKEYLAELAKDNPNPRFKAIVLKPTWQQLEIQPLKKAVGAAGLTAYAEDGAILLIPSSISALAQASSLVTLAKFSWFTTLVGPESESERLWLLATCVKTLPQDEVLNLLAEGCREGFDKAVAAAEVAMDGACLVIDISSLVAQNAGIG